MVSRSSLSSFTVASTFEREKSSRSRPCTTWYDPLEQVTGKPPLSPSSTPYEPSEGIPIETQSPSGVPRTQSRM